MDRFGEESLADQESLIDDEGEESILIDNDLTLGDVDEKVKTPVQSVLDQISSRYERLHRDRRPSLEYLSADNIRSIFTPYARNPSTFKDMTDDEIREFYNEWWKKYGRVGAINGSFE